MWVTFVREQFRTDDRVDVRNALEELASPLDTYGWSSNAIYTFWDPDTRQTLYVGLAIDIARRFAQHVGLEACRRAGCKRDAIESWFADHDSIGYTIILQTSNNQPMTARLARKLLVDAVPQTDPLPGELRELEGRLIETHRLRYGDRPPWNAIGGARKGQRQAAEIGIDNMFDVVSGRSDSLLVARRSIRDLSEDASEVAFELCMHTARQDIIFQNLGRGTLYDAMILDMLQRLPEPPDESRRRLLECGWCDQPAPFGVG